MRPEPPPPRRPWTPLALLPPLLLVAIACSACSSTAARRQTWVRDRELAETDATVRERYTPEQTIGDRLRREERQYAQQMQFGHHR